MGQDLRISALTALTTPANDDLAVLVDVSDITMAASGTDKKVTLANLFFRDIVDVTDGSTVVGHAQVIAANDVAGVAVTLIADGTRDVTAGIFYIGVVKPSSGNADGGASFVLNGGTNDLYNDGGTNVLTLTVNANGSVTVQRTAGALTYDLVIQACWI